MNKAFKDRAIKMLSVSQEQTKRAFLFLFRKNYSNTIATIALFVATVSILQGFGVFSSKFVPEPSFQLSSIELGVDEPNGKTDVFLSLKSNSDARVTMKSFDIISYRDDGSISDHADLEILGNETPALGTLVSAQGKIRFDLSATFYVACFKFKDEGHGKDETQYFSMSTVDVLWRLERKLVLGPIEGRHQAFLVKNPPCKTRA